MLKTLAITTRVIFALCLPLLLASGIIAIETNCKALYLHGFEKYDVAATTGLAAGELEKAADAIIGYWNNSAESLNVTVIKDGRAFPLFNEREVWHMADVKDLLVVNYLILWVTAAYAALFALWFLYRRRHRELTQNIIAGSALTLGLVITIGVFAALDFRIFFTNFHQLFFRNDYWLLNPATDYLIMLFPNGFWQDAVLYFIVAIVIGSLLPQIAATVYIARHAAARGNLTRRWRL